MTEEQPNTENANSGTQRRQSSNMAQNLIALVNAQNYLVFIDQNGIACVFIRDGTKSKAIAIDSEEFTNLLSSLYYDRHRRIISRQAIDGWLRLIKHQAEGAPPRTLHNRVGYAGGMFYYDLANLDCEVIEVTDDGWRIIKPQEPLFKREVHQLPQVKPQAGEGKTLLAFLGRFNLDPDSKTLVEIWVHAAFISDNKPQPVLALRGDHGSAKTSLEKILKRIIDPSKIESTALTKDENQLTQQLAHTYCLVFDNLSELSEENSDALCRAITGDASMKRKLYTNDGVFIYSFKRVISLNSISSVIYRPDLLDRSISLELERVPEDKRLTESEFFKEFEEWRPFILNEIFETLVKARRIYKGLVLKDLPRMADFAKWGEAIAQAKGYPAREFLRIYRLNQGEQTADLLAEDLVAIRLIALMDKQSEWIGTATQLLRELTGNDSQELEKNKAWPKTARWLSSRIRKIKPNLAEWGINMDLDYKRTGAEKIDRIWKEVTPKKDLPEAKDWV